MTHHYGSSLYLGRVPCTYLHRIGRALIAASMSKEGWGDSNVSGFLLWQQARGKSSQSIKTCSARKSVAALTLTGTRLPYTRPDSVLLLLHARTTHARTHARIHARTHARTNTHVCAQTRTCTHIHTYTHINKKSPPNLPHPSLSRMHCF